MEHAFLLEDLTDRERSLVDSARRGGELLCSGFDVDELACSENLDHHIRAGLIRELLLGRRGELDPRGIKIRGARIVGTLDLDFVHAKTGLSLVECAIPAPISARFAHMSQLVLTKSRIGAFNGTGLRVVDGLFLDEVRAQSSSPDSLICVVGARVGGTLNLKKSELSNTLGPVLQAARAEIDGNLELSGMQASGIAERGAIRLVGARIGGYFNCTDAVVMNSSGPAVQADRLKVAGSAYLGGLHASGGGARGTIRLNAAHIVGQLALMRAEVLHEGSGSNFDFDSTRVEGIVFFPVELICSVANKEASCSGLGRIDLDGFTFGSLRRISWKEWLHLIRFHKPNYLTDPYRAAPYQQLAITERAAGHDGHARHILIAQQRDFRVHDPGAVGGWTTRRFHWLWGALAGYGYRTRRTALALFLALASAGLLGYAAGQIDTRPGHRVAERVAAAGGTAGIPCSNIELVGLGLDRGLPLAPTGLRARCDLDTATRWGEVFTVAIWIIQFIIWGLATLALAGYTSLVRKTSS